MNDATSLEATSYAVRLLPGTLSCTVAGANVQLTAQEYRVLAVLMETPQKLIARYDIECALYGDNPPNSNVLQVIISRLRAKFTSAGAPGLLHTRRSHGYAFIGEVTGEAAA